MNDLKTLSNYAVSIEFNGSQDENICLGVGISFANSAYAMKANELFIEQYREGDMTLEMIMGLLTINLRVVDGNGICFLDYRLNYDKALLKEILTYYTPETPCVLAFGYLYGGEFYVARSEVKAPLGFRMNGYQLSSV